MKVLITGATGFIGKRLVEVLSKKENIEISILTRGSTKNLGKINYYHWNPETNIPTAALEGVDTLINLMGENLSAKRWTDHQKKILEESRVKNTGLLLKALKKHNDGCKVIISASAIGIYPKNTDRELTEETELDTDFLGDLCKNWEDQINLFKDCQRKVIIRFGVVLGKDGGALSKMLPIFKLGLGGKIGSGSQYMSWIHLDDLVNIITEALLNERYHGVLNGVAPKPVTNQEFTKQLAKTLNRPAIFPVPAFILKILMGEMSSIVLDSAKVVPKNLNKIGFNFKYPTIDLALSEILTHH
jgi:uncharacterized protein